MLIIRLLFYAITLNYTKILKVLLRIMEKLGILITIITGFKGKKYKNIFGK